eukprot:jgi/Galph1/5307/GphlegSOOS_G3905.1
MFNIGRLKPDHTRGIYASDAYRPLGVDNSFSVDDFQRNLKATVVKRDEEELVLELIGIDAPLVNAIRRILLAEVPTMAIEHVLMSDNTSVIHDEILAHRLGLIPIRADANLFREYERGAEPQEDNCIIFRLQVECKKKKTVKPGADTDERYENSKVYSGDLEWVPLGEQVERFGEKGIRPVHEDILLAKLRPGQRIELEARCTKGIGKIHAKWSPVATAYYAMYPQVQLIEDIRDTEAHQLVKKCPMQVFDIEEVSLAGEQQAMVEHEESSSTKGSSSHVRAKVISPQRCTMCRECIREEGWEKKVRLSKVRDHFLFSIQGTGCIPTDELFLRALNVMRSKCDILLDYFVTKKS